MAQDNLLILYCVNCLATGVSQKIAVSPEDTIATCPNCQRHYSLETKHLNAVQNQTTKGNHFQYLLELLDAQGVQRLKKVETREGMELRAGGLITLVYQGHTLVGVSDHQRHLWFTVQPAASKFPQLGRFYKFLSLIIIICAALQGLRLLGVLRDFQSAYGLISFFIFILIGSAIVGLPLLLEKINNRMTVEEELPVYNLSLPDIDE